MDTNTNNPYLFKALDAYPFELDTAVEALNYALSYDPENTEALYLMADLYGYQLGDYETAKSFYEMVLSINLNIPKVYPDYLYILIKNEDFAEAQKLLAFALKVKATDKPLFRLLQGQLMEKQGTLKPALQAYKEAKKKGQNTMFINFAKSEITRVKEKLPKRKKSKKKSKKKTSKGKKKNRSK